MSKITLMQFSDLHKSEGSSENDNVLISSIVSDINRQKSEDPKISKPDFLVICGDIIQGSANGSSYEEGIQEINIQYKEAEKFLDHLCQKLFNGDKKNIILIPGNHDISWPHSINSMEKLEKPDKKYTKIFKTPSSKIRWCWTDLAFYQIVNELEYNNRFASFSEFYKSFYEGARSYSLKPEEQYNIFEFPEKKILFLGLNSCYYNDHLNDFGSINCDCIVSCHEKISQEVYKDWIKIAVWHHGIYGIPGCTDYLDQGVIQFLIDKGFHIGLHGHQHKSDFVDVKFIIDQSVQMPTLGCGTLCASYRDIPPGETRQYSIIEIDKEQSALTLFIRKALDQTPDLPIWMSECIKQNNNERFMIVPFGRMNMTSFKHEEMQEITTESIDLEALTQIDFLISTKEYQLALDKLKNLNFENQFVRKLILECLSNLERDDEIITFIKEPKDVGEFTYLTEALWRVKSLTELRRVLENSKENMEIAQSSAYSRISRKFEDRENYGKN